MPDGNTLTLVQKLTQDQAAICWLVVTNGLRPFAFAVNALGTATGKPAGSPPAGSITRYRVSFFGNLTELGVTLTPRAPAGVPVDDALSLDGRYLYVLSEGDGTISAYKVGFLGGLTLLKTYPVTAKPAIATNGPFPNGLAAR
jgi:hypothetical protein